MHADDMIAKISGQLYNSIVTQGIMVDEIKLLKENTKKFQEEIAKLRAKSDEVKTLEEETDNQDVVKEKESEDDEDYKVASSSTLWQYFEASNS